jgi:hypothetical protein
MKISLEARLTHLWRKVQQYFICSIRGCRYGNVKSLGLSGCNISHHRRHRAIWSANAGRNRQVADLWEGEPMTRAVLASLTLLLMVSVSLASGQEPNNVQDSQDATAAEKANATYRVSGRVVDDVTGSPLSGVTVRFQIAIVHISCVNCNPPLPPPPEPPPAREIVTGKDGSFAFDNVPAKNFSITAEKTGYMDAWQIGRHADEPKIFFLAGEHMKPIVLRLAPTASITGVLRDHNGAVIQQNQIISLWRLLAWNGWPTLDYGAFATFDAQGNYRFDNLGPGRYYLVAERVNHEGPAHDKAGNAVGETPMRYPEASEAEPNPFFTLQEGEQRRIDFHFPLKTLHRVTGTMEEDEDRNYSYAVQDADRANTYLVTSSPFERKFEAWLPNGTFWLSAGGDVNGSNPFEVADSDLGGLQFSIFNSGRIEIPIEITIASGDPAGPELEPPRGLWYVTMVRILPRGYVEAVGESTDTQKMEGTPPHRVESVSVVPGDYAVEVAARGNFYAKSVVSGATDLALEPLTIRAGDAPAPMQIVLATGAKAAGIVQRDGKPARAWVYAVAQEIESKTDFRLFAPAISYDEGEFHMQGLAPGTYLFFASDLELPLNIHDADEIAYWRSRGKIVQVEAGKTSNVLLTVAEPPPE